MSLTGGLKAPVVDRAASRSRFAYANVAQALARLMRPARTQAKPAWHACGRIIAGGIAALACIVLVMVFLDARAVEAVKGLPAWVSIVFGEITDFGKSSWFLVPIGLLLVLITALASRALAHSSRLDLASVAVRLGFLFAAPGLKWLMDLGILFFSGAVLFQIITLPVEFDASKRALVQLSSSGAIAPQEVVGAKRVLDAAALTYVAAAAMAALQLLRLVLLRNSRD